MIYPEKGTYLENLAGVVCFLQIWLRQRDAEGHLDHVEMQPKRILEKFQVSDSLAAQDNCSIALFNRLLDVSRSASTTSSARLFTRSLYCMILRKISRNFQNASECDVGMPSLVAGLIISLSNVWQLLSIEGAQDA